MGFMDKAKDAEINLKIAITNKLIKLKTKSMNILKNNDDKKMINN